MSTSKELVIMRNIYHIGSRHPIYLVTMSHVLNVGICLYLETIKSTHTVILPRVFTAALHRLESKLFASD